MSNIPLTDLRILSKETLFEIAKAIDNEYIGTEKTFTANKYIGKYCLSTNKCDWSSLITVYTDDKSITKIELVDEGGRREITDFTYDKIIKMLTGTELTLKQ